MTKRKKASKSVMQWVTLATIIVALAIAATSQASVWNGALPYVIEESPLRGDFRNSPGVMPVQRLKARAKLL